MSGIATAQQARIDEHLNKLVRDVFGKVHTYRDFYTGKMEQGGVLHKRVVSKYKEVPRRVWNSMDGDQQQAHKSKLRNLKYSYEIHMEGSNSYCEVTKIVFDYLAATYPVVCPEYQNIWLWGDLYLTKGLKVFYNVTSGDYYMDDRKLIHGGNPELFAEVHKKASEISEGIWKVSGSTADEISGYIQQVYDLYYNNSREVTKRGGSR